MFWKTIVAQLLTFARNKLKNSLKRSREHKRKRQSQGNWARNIVNCKKWPFFWNVIDIINLNQQWAKRGGVLYKSINQIPSEYRHLFERLIKNGIIKQDINGNINISEEVFEMVLILARLGLLPWISALVLKITSIYVKISRGDFFER